MIHECQECELRKKIFPPGHKEDVVGVPMTEGGQHELGNEAVHGKLQDNICLLLFQYPHLYGQGQWDLGSSFKGHCVSRSLPPQIRPEIRKLLWEAARALAHCSPYGLCAHMCVPTHTTSHQKLAQTLSLLLLWDRKHYTAGLIAFKSPIWNCSGAKPHHYRYTHKAVIINCYLLPLQCGVTSPGRGRSVHLGSIPQLGMLLAPLFIPQTALLAS